MKNPIVLAIIEFVTLGLGTLILGKRKGYGLGMLLGASLLRYEELRIAPLQTGLLTIHWALMLIGLTVMGAIMAREVYVAASTPDAK